MTKETISSLRMMEMIGEIAEIDVEYSLKKIDEFEYVERVRGVLRNK